MPIPLSHMKERLSVAYVKAVIAKAGAISMGPDGIEYGTDVVARKVKVLPNGKYSGTGWPLHCQLKATTTWIEKNQDIVYDLSVDAYNKLASWEGSPCILVLFRLPKDSSEWLKLDENSLELRNCCYWTHLKGTPSTNRSSVRITIPRNQLFSPKAVSNLLDKISANHGMLP